MNSIEFHNVTKMYENGVHALDGVTMTVPAGAIFGFSWLIWRSRKNKVMPSA